VIAVSDGNKKLAAELSRNLNCTAYADYQELVLREKPDIVFAFGRHIDMPKIAEFLINEEIPFVIEKPAGVSSRQIKELVLLQKKLGTFVAIPFVFRYSSLMDSILSIKQAGQLGQLTHCYFRFIAGSPQRYIQANSSWMLDPTLAGGGCTMNLAVHFIDLFLHFTQVTVSSVYTVLNSLTHKTKVEDFSAIVLKTKKDQIGIIETGYTYPENEGKSREIYYSITTTEGLMWARDNTLHWIRRGAREKKLAISTETDEYYAIYVEKVLQEFLKGIPPRTSLKDMYEVMLIMDAVYKSGTEKKVVIMA
jgi:predicted dehydrogenase